MVQKYNITIDLTTPFNINIKFYMNSELMDIYRILFFYKNNPNTVIQKILIKRTDNNIDTYNDITHHVISPNFLNIDLFFKAFITTSTRNLGSNILDSKNLNIISIIITTFNSKNMLPILKSNQEIKQILIQEFNARWPN